MLLPLLASHHPAEAETWPDLLYVTVFFFIQLFAKVEFAECQAWV